MFAVSGAVHGVDANWNNTPGTLPTGVTHHSFNSAVVGAAVGFNIYLPPNYATETVSYPVIYHLHGSGGYENHEVQLANTLQTHILNGNLPKMIMVFANGYNDSFYGNSAPGAAQFRPVEKTIMGELIQHVEDNFRVQPGREFRGMQGFSMGGQGANLYGHKYPEMFKTLVNFASGCRDWYSMKSSWNNTILNIYANQRYSYEPYDSWHWVNVYATTGLKNLKMRSVVGSGDHLFENNKTFLRNTCSLDLPVQFIVTTNGHDINSYYAQVLPSGDTLGLDTMKFHARAFAQVNTPAFSGAFAATAIQNQAFSYQCQASGAPTAYAATGLPTGLSIDANGLISGTVTGATGIYFVNLTATNAADTGAATLVIYVESGNPTVVLKNQDYSIARTGYAFRYQLLLEKPMPAGGPAVTYSATGLPAWLSLDTSTGVLTGTPPAAATHAIVFSATNGLTTGSQNHTLYVGTNTAPVITAPASATHTPTAQDYGLYTLKTLADDDNGEPRLTYAWTVNGPSGAVAVSPGASNAAKRATVEVPHPGTYAIELTVSDADGLTDTEAINLVVPNFAPTDIALSGAVVVENAAAQTLIGSFSTTDANLDADVFTYTLTDDAGGRFVVDSAGALRASGSGLDYESATQHTITVRCTDYSGSEFSKNFVIQVQDVTDGVAVVTWPDPANIIYGAELTSLELNAAANVAGQFVYNPPLGTVLNAGTHTLTCTFNPDDTLQYSPVNATAQLIVQKAPVECFWGETIFVYGTPLNYTHHLDAIIEGRGPNPTGILSATFVYTPDAGTVLEVGTHTLSVVFTPDDPNYEGGSFSTLAYVEKITPDITYNPPADIVYGTALSATELSATSSVPGVFTFNPPLGTVLNAGLEQHLDYSFTPTDTAHYKTLTGGYQVIDVLKKGLTITALSQSREYGEANPPLTVFYAGFVNGDTAASLDMPVTLSTTAVESSPIGSYPIVASGAADTNYSITYVNGALFVTAEEPVITWPAPGPIVAGTPLSYNVSVNVPGTLLYFPSPGTVLGVGTHTIAVEFIPDDDTNYINAAADRTQVVVANSVPAFSSAGITFSPGAPLAGEAVQFQAAASDMDGHTLSYAWNFGDGTNGTGTPASHSYTAPGAFTVQCTVTDGFGGAASANVTVVVAAPATPFPGVRINFQPQGRPVPAGYLADTGAPFGARGNDYSYGWNANNATTARDRNAPASPDQRYDTLQHMQKPENAGAFWELEIPNGMYRVDLVSGDPSYIDSVYRILAEDTLILAGTPTGTRRWFTGSAIVNVNDGRLTLRSAPGAVNNKICFVDITAAVAAREAEGPVEEGVPELLPLNITSLSGALNFTKENADTLKLKLTLPGLESTFLPDGKTLELDAMGATLVFEFKKNRGKSSLGTCSLSFDKKLQAWTAQISLSRAALSPAWSDALERGTTRADLPFAVAVKVNGLVFGGERETRYSNTNLKRGQMK